MTIKLTVREAIAAYIAIERLPRLPDGKIGYTLGRIADFCEQEQRRYQRELVKLQKDMAGPPDSDGKIKINSDKQYEYIEAEAALLDHEIEIPREPVTVEQVLGNKEPPQIEPGIWRALAKIVVEK